MGTTDVAAPPTGGDLLTETFDNVTDYDNAGWSSQGTVNPNYTTTVLEGTQSCFFDANADNAILDHTFTSQTTVYVYLMWRTAVAFPGNSMIFMIGNVSETECFRAYVKSGGGGGLVYFDSNGVTSSEAVTVLSTNTTYHFWSSYTKGTGANAAVTLAFSTDGVRPTSGNNYISMTNGGGAVNAEWLRLRLEPNTGWNAIYDRILVSTTQLGNNP